jgi:hypothetical protein
LNEKLKKGEVEMAHNMVWMVIKWQNKKEVYMITSVHEFEFAKTGKKDYLTKRIK